VTTGSSGDCSLTGAIRAISYCTTTVDNPITGEKQRAALATAGGGVGTTGAIRNGGSVWRSLPDNLLQQYVDQVGTQVVQKSVVKSAPILRIPSAA